jgi:hypothetical protein
MTRKRNPLTRDDPRVQAFAKDRFPDFPLHDVARTENLVPAQCYGNVRQRVLDRGGAMILGYLIILWPEHGIEALHHAVWKTPGGTLRDITGPAYHGMETTTVCAFALQGRWDHTKNYDPIAASKFEFLTDDPVFHQMAAALQDRTDLQRQCLPLVNRLSRAQTLQKRRALHQNLEELSARLNDASDRASSLMREMGY